MKRLAYIAVVCLLVLGVGGATTASGADNAGRTKSAKKRCKPGKSFRKGKCRRLATPWPDNSPRDFVRATLSWSGPGNLDLMVKDAQDRVAGWGFSLGFFANQIPSATHQGDVSDGGT